MPPSFPAELGEESLKKRYVRYEIHIDIYTFDGILGKLTNEAVGTCDQVREQPPAKRAMSRPLPSQLSIFEGGGADEAAVFRYWFYRVFHIRFVFHIGFVLEQCNSQFRDGHGME
ncbi:hypothetical protein SBDP1_590037 [Syntrophobacter sp. SbD1]|nr:hypothetical protein SBDP1_590037 [Syntrophobacter sp. SbD1]